VIQQILDKSEYYNRIMDSLIPFKEKMEHTQDEESLLKLSNELQLQLNRMSKLKEYAGYIHELFRIIPSRSERLQQAEAYFYQGKFPEMDEVLDATKIRAEIERQNEIRFSAKDKEQEQKARIRTDHKSYELIVKAFYRYTFIEYPKWYEEVFDLLRDAEAFSTNVQAMYELGAYLKDTDEREWAFQLLNDAYVISGGIEGEIGRLYEAKSLWAMGILSRRENDYPEAIEYLRKSVKIYTDLSETNPAEYLPMTSNMLTVLGDCHTFSKNFSVALVVFEEAVNIRRKLALYGNWEESINLADVLDKLATVHLCLGRFGEAVPLYEEALRIKEGHIEKNLYIILESKASTLYNLAITHFAAQEYEKSIRRTKEELVIRKQVQDIDPFGQLPLLARSRALLGDLYLYTDRPEDAIREREKVVKLYKLLAKCSGDKYLPNLGEAVNHCSNLYFRMKSYGKYFLSLQEALEIFRKLATSDPEEYLPTVGCLLGNVCHYYERVAPNKKKAVENARESYKILSSIERSETAELAFTHVKRIIGEV
jgi:tetratricopeptide (TPR) repeat protein